jgi:hypothetical protein
MQSVCVVKYVINKTFDKQESCLIKATQHLIPLFKFSAKLLIRSPINYYKQRLLNQAVYDPVLTLYNDHIFVHFTFIAIQWEHVNLNSLDKKNY